jgi:beta-lactamase regulating signal transducer with metallopeptidase domain
MPQLSYSFCMSMLHSLWQAGLLLLVYFFAEIVVQQKAYPLQKRNWLFVLLLSQIILFILTFSIYYFNTADNSGVNSISHTITNILSANSIHAATPWLFSFYLLVISYKMTRALYEWIHFKKQFHSGLQKPAIDLKLFTAAKANHFGIKRKVQLWFSNTITVPVTFGFLKPVIILPVALINQLTLQQAETLILHELTHIKTNDYLLNWFLIIAENIFFFNPFVLTLCKKIRLEREKYCDSNVIAFEYAPLLYAETLLKAQYMQQQVTQYQLAAVTGKKQLLQRIQFFTDKKNNVSPKKRPFIMPILAGLLITIFSAVLFFQYTITAKPVKISADVAVTPFTQVTSELNTPLMVNNILESFTEENLKSLVEVVEQQQPIIEKQLKKIAPVIKAIKDKVQAMQAKNEAEVQQAKEMDDENILTPISIKENDATRQIVVKEEQSGSKNATVKVYTLAFINDEWVLIPEWMLAAKEVLTDSIPAAITDSSLILKQKLFSKD